MKTNQQWIADKWTGDIRDIDGNLICSVADSNPFDGEIADCNSAFSERERITTLISRAPEMQTEIERLKAINAELVAELQDIETLAMCAKNCADLDAGEEITRVMKIARAALAKAQS